PTPAPVSNLSGVVGIVGINAASMALTEDPLTKVRTVWSWGRNQSGQLGHGAITADSDLSNALPGRVVNLDTVVAIDGVTAVRSGGTVWSGGWNAFGEVGDGTIAPNPPGGPPTPVQVPGVVAPVALDYGHYHRFAVDLAAEYTVELRPPVNADGTSVF